MQNPENVCAEFVGIMLFSAAFGRHSIFDFLPLADFWFQGSDTKSKAVVMVLICHRDAKSVYY